MVILMAKPLPAIGAMENENKPKKKRGNPDIVEAGKATRFSKDNPPKRRKSGKNMSTILKELAEGDTIRFNISVTSKGKTKTQEGVITSGDGSSIQEALAVLCLQKALAGDFKWMHEVLNRLEGKAINKVAYDQNAPVKIIIEEVDEDI